jgi:hypothetical protein
MIQEYYHQFDYTTISNYKRLEQPLLTIMYPTRNRSEILKDIIDRFQDTIGKKIPIEICIKADIDDEKTIQAISQIKYSNVRFIISDRREGYGSMGDYWNELVNISNGLFLMLWNDDSWLDTDGNLAEVLLNADKNIPCIIRSEARKKECYFRVIHWLVWDQLRKGHGYRGGRGIFESLVYCDLYFMDHVENTVKGHVTPEEFDACKFELIATYEYSHWEHDKIINSKDQYNTSEEVKYLMQKVGKKGYEEVEKDKEDIKKDQPQLFYHPGGRRMNDLQLILDLVFLNWRQYSTLSLEDRLKVINKRSDFIIKYRSHYCDDLYRLIK